MGEHNGKHNAGRNKEVAEMAVGGRQEIDSSACGFGGMEVAIRGRGRLSVRSAPIGPRKALTASNFNPGELRSGRKLKTTSYPLSLLLR